MQCALPPTLTVPVSSNNITLKLDETESKITLVLDEKECLTNTTWHELISQAIKSYMPYYQIAVHVCQSDKGKVIKVYDGIFARKDKKVNSSSIDFETRLPIVATHYLFLKCFDTDKRGNIVPISTDNYCFKPLDDKIFNEAEIKNVALESLNYNALKNDYESILTKCQYVVGINLLHGTTLNSFRGREGWRWIFAAQYNGNPEAQQFYKKYKEKLPKKNSLQSAKAI